MPMVRSKIGGLIEFTFIAAPLLLLTICKDPLSLSEKTSLLDVPSPQPSDPLDWQVVFA